VASNGMIFYVFLSPSPPQLDLINSENDFSSSLPSLTLSHLFIVASGSVGVVEKKKKITEPSQEEGERIRNDKTGFI
jgi:hypothetical protein